MFFRPPCPSAHEQSVKGKDFQSCHSDSPEGTLWGPSWSLGPLLQTLSHPQPFLCWFGKWYRKNPRQKLWGHEDNKLKILTSGSFCSFPTSKHSWKYHPRETVQATFSSLCIFPFWLKDRPLGLNTWGADKWSWETDFRRTDSNYGYQWSDLCGDKH